MPDDEQPPAAPLRADVRADDGEASVGELEDVGAVELFPRASLVGGRAEAAERPRYRQLTSWERTGAVAAGLAVGAVGFVAMFVTKNEAGVAVAILLAGVLLVIGIQGTQIGKLGKDGAGFMAREEDRREIAQAAREVAVDDPAKAEAMLEGYQVADPASRSSPDVADASDFVHERRIIRALELNAEELGVTSIDRGRRKRGSVDARLEFGDAFPVGIVIDRRTKWERPTPESWNFDVLTQRADLAEVRAVVSVSDRGSGRRWAFDHKGVIILVVTWTGAEGDTALIDAIKSARRRLRDKATTSEP
ncbi:hypothetical protein ACPPVO_43620 [Dactylosporangium sp. McL0621]|uniref:hypothetical protein n=1 Tax=Dactylosporangium sp. McL0621 TaxID=3415678 RepID=UPI003CF0426B